MKTLKTAAVLALAIGLFGIGTAQAWDEVFVTTTYSRPTVYYRTYSPVYYTTYAPATVYVSRPAYRVYYPAPVTYVSGYSTYSYRGPSSSKVTVINW